MSEEEERWVVDEWTFETSYAMCNGVGVSSVLVQGNWLDKHKLRVEDVVRAYKVVKGAEKLARGGSSSPSVWDLKRGEQLEGLRGGMAVEWIRQHWTSEVDVGCFSYHGNFKHGYQGVGVREATFPGLIDRVASVLGVTKQDDGWWRPSDGKAFDLTKFKKSMWNASYYSSGVTATLGGFEGEVVFRGGAYGAIDWQYVFDTRQLLKAGTFSLRHPVAVPVCGLIFGPDKGEIEVQLIDGHYWWCNGKGVVWVSGGEQVQVVSGGMFRGLLAKGVVSGLQACGPSVERLASFRYLREAYERGVVCLVGE
jgi:hypothetical protein